MIQVQVAIAARPDELTGLEVTLLRHHVGEQRIGGDVERHAEQRIGAALVQLARQPPVGHIELEQRMARQQAPSGRVRRRSTRSRPGASNRDSS